MYLLFYFLGIFNLLLAFAQQPRLIVEMKTNTSIIRVHQCGSRRDLCLNTRGTNTIQSSINMDEPLRAIHEYSNTMLCSLLWNPEPNNVLVIGLGGGVIPRTFRYYYPKTIIDIVEIDPNIVQIAKEHFLFKIDPLMNLFVNDARLYIRSVINQQLKTYDIIFSDAFTESDEGTPFHLKTVEYLFELKQLLAKQNGILVTYIQKDSSDYYNSRQTYSFVFKYNYAFSGQTCNCVVLVSYDNHLFPILTQTQMINNAIIIQENKQFMFNLTMEALKLENDEHKWSNSGTVLNDRAR
ncbi:unnamed protein product, partial [Didymodactylos carnosus]